MAGKLGLGLLDMEGTVHQGVKLDMECTVHQGVESYSHPLDIHILRRKQNPGSKQILMQLIMFTEMKRCFSLKTNLRRKFSTQVHVCKLFFLEI